MSIGERTLVAVMSSKVMFSTTPPRPGIDRLANATDAPQEDAARAEDVGADARGHAGIHLRIARRERPIARCG